MLLDVEPCANTENGISTIYHEASPPREVYCIKYLLGEEEKPMQVTGWDGESNTPCPAYACKIEESGDGIALLIYGGSGGIRMKELEDESNLDCQSATQWVQTHLLYPKDSFIVFKDEI